MQRIDIVLFGATGFTGKLVARELARIFRNERFTWAIAGRSREKLTELLNHLNENYGPNLNSDVAKIIVDVNDTVSVNQMCEKAKIIINCVGPYRFYGEAIVKECLKTNTHHLDVSGEPEFLERMQFKYDQMAFDNNLFIIGACAMDSVPADLGMVFIENEFNGELNHVESYLTINSNGAAIKLNYATWESAVNGFASFKELKSLRKQLFQVKLPKSQFKPPNRTNILGYFYNSYLKKYVMKFFGSDSSVVQRSQYLNYTLLNKKPIQYYAYFTLETLSYVRKFLFYGLLISILSKYKFGRMLLLKYYKFFTGGLASKNDIDLKDLEKITFEMNFFGYGWKDKLQNPNEQHTNTPDTSIHTRISGPEPGYFSASKIVVQCALVLLNEKHKIPIKGGVLTPAFAFSSTSLIQRLQNSGIEFKNMNKPSIKPNL